MFRFSQIKSSLFPTWRRSSSPSTPTGTQRRPWPLTWKVHTPKDTPSSVLVFSSKYVKLKNKNKLFPVQQIQFYFFLNYTICLNYLLSVLNISVVCFSMKSQSKIIIHTICTCVCIYIYINMCVGIGMFALIYIYTLLSMIICPCIYMCTLFFICILRKLNK